MNTIYTEAQNYSADIIMNTARAQFGIAYLYPWQTLVIANILDAASASEKNISESDAAQTFDEDGAERGHQIILLPTGAGKSLCFLIPALILNGPTLIIYPLLALMADQRRRITELGIESVIFRGQQTAQEREENFRRIRLGTRLILANPEVLQALELRKKLRDTGIMHIAIDEAHCVSEWGDTFRPAYLTLGPLIRELAVPTVSAFTATASHPVLKRITEALFSGKAHIIRGEADRPNIQYTVRHICAKRPALLKEIQNCKRPAVIFCGSRKRTEAAARFLKEFLREENTVRFYHAGLLKEEKTAVEAWFYPRTDAILVSTCAFGMGVDKKDIRTVIHLDPPPTAEAYIQEAGRSGRDGQTAEAILLWSPKDSRNARGLPPGSRGRALVDFAEKGTCRRQVLLDALGAEKAVCSGCDVCGGTADNTASDIHAVYHFIRINRRSYTQTEAAEYIRQILNGHTVQKHRWDKTDIWLLFEELFVQKKLRILLKVPWKGKIDITQ